MEKSEKLSGHCYHWAMLLDNWFISGTRDPCAPPSISLQLQVVQLLFLFSAAPHKFQRTTVVEDQSRRMPVMWSICWERCPMPLTTNEMNCRYIATGGKKGGKSMRVHVRKLPQPFHETRSAVSEWNLIKTHWHTDAFPIEVPCAHIIKSLRPPPPPPPPPAGKW